MSVSENTVVVGAPYGGSNATGYLTGAAYVFVRSLSVPCIWPPQNCGPIWKWSQQAYLKASNAEADDQFGLSVAVSGETAVVVAPYEGSNATGVDGDQTNNSADDSGAAYVFNTCPYTSNVLCHLEDLKNLVAGPCLLDCPPPELTRRLVYECDLAIQYVTKEQNGFAIKALEQFVQLTEQYMAKGLVTKAKGREFITAAQAAIEEIQPAKARR